MTWNIEDFKVLERIADTLDEIEARLGEICAVIEDKP